jgi:hypothetical protein
MTDAIPQDAGKLISKIVVQRKLINSAERASQDHIKVDGSPGEHTRSPDSVDVNGHIKDRLVVRPRVELTVRFSRVAACWAD